MDEDLARFLRNVDRGGTPSWRDKIGELLDSDGQVNQDFFDLFASPRNPPRQREVFRMLRAASMDTRSAYFSAAIQAVRSPGGDLSDKKEILESLAAFVNSSEEGISRFDSSFRDTAYNEALDSLADCLMSGTIRRDAYDEIFRCLAQMDYFRVKRTMMLAFVEYKYPHDASWFAKRLSLCLHALRNGGKDVVWHVLAFLSNSYSELRRVLQDPHVHEDEVSNLEETLTVMDSIVPLCLTSSDYRIVICACGYCKERGLASALPIIKNLQGSGNDQVREIATAAVKTLAEDDG